LISQEIEVVDQFPLPVEVDGEQVGIFYLDLLVEGQVVVEIKSIDKR
jgi:GxxExxY protein